MCEGRGSSRATTLSLSLGSTALLPAKPERARRDPGTPHVPSLGSETPMTEGHVSRQPAKGAFISKARGHRDTADDGTWVQTVEMGLEESGEAFFEAELTGFSSH